MSQWESGRRALNQFSEALNTATGTQRIAMIPVPPSHTPETALCAASEVRACVCSQEGGIGYPRSKERYVQLNKDAALCRARGGEALAGVWGQLMVYGTVPGVNPCGNVNLGNYFS